MSTIENHWALCDKSGAVFYDDCGRAHIYSTRDEARESNRELSDENLHIEKVEIK